MAKLTQKRSKEIYDYNAESGCLIWKIRLSNATKVGDDVGSVNNNGYLITTVDYNNYIVHRLIFLWNFGRWPKQQLDHINGIKTDNRLKNLREVSNQENQRNITIPKRNSSGFCGVYWDKEFRKWRAQIRMNYKLINLGRFEDIEGAILARKQANIKYGFHENHGKKQHKGLSHAG